MSEMEEEYGTTENDIVSKLLDYINVTPELLSLLYDLGWCPEQLKHGSSEWCKMILLADSWHRLMGKDKITWHDPEQEKPADRKSVIVICQNRREVYWRQGFWLPSGKLKNLNGTYYESGWYEWSENEETLYPLSNVLKWGEFKLPRIEEAGNADSSRE